MSVAVPPDLAEVGYVAGAYGVAGMVRVHPHASDAQALLKVKTWWLDQSGLRSVTVRSSKLHGGDVVAQLEELSDRNMAEALKGASVQIPRSQFPSLPSDEFYWSDLMGLAVVNLQGEAIGQVHDMMDNGAQSILRVANPSAEGAEFLIPFVDQFVKTVDLPGKTITVDWGLDY